LSIGGTAEKIVSALHTVLSEHPDEDTDLDNCKAAVRRLEKMEKDVEVACARGNFARMSNYCFNIVKNGIVFSCNTCIGLQINLLFC